MVFSLAAVPAIMVVGAGIDIANAIKTKHGIQQSVDAATLATAKLATTESNTGKLTAFANNYLSANTRGAPAVLNAGYPSVNSTTGEVCLKAGYAVATSLMRIINVTSISVEAQACAQVAAGSYEVALVLDTTGSMSSSDNSGQSKLTSMKNAANSFIDTMFDSPTLGPRTKMSVVPFAPSVNVGTTYETANWMDTTGASSWHFNSPAFAPDATIASNRFALFNVLKTVRSSWDWGGCVESLPYPLNTTDDAPSPANPDSLFVPMFAPDEPADVTHTETYYDSRGRLKTRTVTDATYNNSYIADKGFCSTSAPTGASISDQTTAQSRLCKYKSATNLVTSNGPNEKCTSKPLVRMQSTKSSLKTAVNGVSASGTTNIHEGFMWGWRTVSPNAPFADGKAYGTENNLKVVILMTDGQNTWYEANNALNGSDYSAYGHYNAANGRLPTTHQNLTTETQARAAMDQLVRDSCTAARAKGVIIYTIAFSVNSDPMDNQAKQLLKDCAGDESRYFEPGTQSTLTTAFTAIGTSIGKLRLSR